MIRMDVPGHQPNPEIPKLMLLQMEKVRVTNPLIPGPGLQIPTIVIDNTCCL